MRSALLLLLLSLTSAQTEAAKTSKSDFCKYSLKAMRDVDQSLAKVRELAAKFGIRVEDVMLDLDSVSKKYPAKVPALKISTTGDHQLNKEAARVEKLFEGLQFVYSPAHLADEPDTWAYFDESENRLYMAEMTFKEGRAYEVHQQHEIVHAWMQHLMRGGRESLFHGEIDSSLVPISKELEGGSYAKYMSFEEVYAQLTELRQWLIEIENTTDAKMRKKETNQWVTYLREYRGLIETVREQSAISLETLKESARVTVSKNKANSLRPVEVLIPLSDGATKTMNLILPAKLADKSKKEILEYAATRQRLLSGLIFDLENALAQIPLPEVRGSKGEFSQDLITRLKAILAKSRQLVTREHILK